MFIIFGSPRSGTTLLAQCLDSNTKIVVPEETDFIIPSAFLFDRIADVQIRKHLLSELIVNSANFSSNIGVFLSSDEVREIVSRCGASMSELLLGIYGAIAVKGNGVIAGDKSPNDLNFLRILSKVGGLTPEIRIIHIVRDVRDVVASLLPLKWSSNVESYFPRLWNASNLNLHCLYREKPEYMLVKYEELAQFPRDTIELVCAHIGVDFQPEQMSAERRLPRHRIRTAHAMLGQPISTVSVGNYRQTLDPALIETVERQAAEALKTFDYGFSSPFGRDYLSL